MTTPDKKKVTLIVNDKPIPLNTFASSIIQTTVKGMLNALKDVPTPKKIELIIDEE